MKNRKDIVLSAGTVNIAMLRIQINTLLKVLKNSELTSVEVGDISGVVALLDNCIDQSGIDLDEKDKLFIKNHFSISHIGAYYENEKY